MKKVTLLLLILTTAMTYSQVGINTDTPDASSALEIKSTSAGILIPRMTEAQRDAIASPALSLMIYQTNNDSGFYFFDGSAWKKIEGVAGPQGVAGTNGSDGQDGDSVYQIWLDAGNTGTEADFLNALKGTDGTNGTNGTNGQDGDSAYQIWLNAGNTGTEADFLSAITGADGTNGTNGQDGDSAYQIWLDAGNTGTEADFLNALKGTNGADGTNGVGVSGIVDNGDGTITYNFTDSNSSTITNSVADGIITTSKLADNSVTSSKISDGAVSESKLADDSIGLSKIQDASITNAKIASNAAIGFDKLDVTKANITGLGLLDKDEILPGYRVTLGSDAGISTTGGYSVAIGREALKNWEGSYNTAVGSFALKSATSGSYNQAFGAYALTNRTTGSYATAFGAFALENLTTGTFNTAVGNMSGNEITTGSSNTLLGYNTSASSATGTNQTVIGAGATGAGDNTIQLGNNAITNVKTSGSITAGTVTYPNTDGTTGQILSTDGNGNVSFSDKPFNENTDYSAVKLINSLNTVPSGKTWKIISALPNRSLATNSNYAILINGTKIYIGASQVGSTGTDNYNRTNYMNYLLSGSFYLPENTTLNISDNIGLISVVEFDNSLLESKLITTTTTVPSGVDWKITNFYSSVGLNSDPDFYLTINGTNLYVGATRYVSAGGNTSEAEIGVYNLKGDIYVPSGTTISFSSNIYGLSVIEYEN